MDNINKKINDLFDKLEESKLYNDYLRVKKQLEANDEIMNLINEIKRYQKILANNNDKSVGEKLKSLRFNLESYPIYQSYLGIKEELENELFEIKDTFEKYFKDILKL